MTVRIIAVDKVRETYLRDGCALYVRRLARLLATSIHEVRPGTPVSEARAILRQVPTGATVWALEREGVALSSIDLAKRIAALRERGVKALFLGIGGPDGLHRSVLERADFAWSLSPLTLLHEMARLVALEQLYRAMKIIRGEPYHR